MYLRMSLLFAKYARLPPPLLDALQQGTAGVLLSPHCSGGPARASSDGEDEKPAARNEEQQKAAVHWR